MSDEPGPAYKAPLGRFQPGASGNPSGVSKARLAVREMLEGAAPEAFKRLMEIMRNGEDKHALQASQLVLAYAIGKPTERDDEGRILMTPVAQALLDMAREKK